MYNLFIVFFSCIIVTTAMVSKEDQAKHPNFHLLPQPPNCSNPYGSDRIVGGTFAAMGQFPWMARVGYIMENCDHQLMEPSFNCAGSLISRNFVLTAAHCVKFSQKLKCLATGRYENVLPKMVRLGEHDLKKSIDCEQDVCADKPQDIFIKRIVAHKHFDGSTFIHDITILELEKNAKINEWVSPICLPIGDMLLKNYTKTMAQVAGWGRTGNSGRFVEMTTDILKFVYIPIEDMSKCKKYFTTINKNGGQLCVGGEQGEDSCTGDSGGPLMIVDTEAGTPREYQVGIVSYGYIECGSDGVPALYTDVRVYTQWILDHLIE